MGTPNLDSRQTYATPSNLTKKRKSDICRVPGPSIIPTPGGLEGQIPAYDGHQGPADQGLAQEGRIPASGVQILAADHPPERRVQDHHVGRSSHREGPSRAAQ